MALPSLTGWKSEAIRITFFASEPVNAQGKNWWSIATGTSPESIASKPNSAEYSEGGPIDGKYFLEMKVTFNRIDWILLPIMAPDSTPPSLGETESALPLLIPFVQKWLESITEKWVRIAYGHTGLFQTENIPSANKAISDYLPEFSIPPENARDVIIQLNYPRQCKTFKELVVNRIIKIMSVTAHFFTVGNTPFPEFKELTFLRMELDLSTNAERNTEIPREHFPEILSEMQNSCKEIFEAGMKL